MTPTDVDKKMRRNDNASKKMLDAHQKLENDKIEIDATKNTGRNNNAKCRLNSTREKAIVTKRYRVTKE